jgi:hypothetical protein
LPNPARGEQNPAYRPAFQFILVGDRENLLLQGSGACPLVTDEQLIGDATFFMIKLSADWIVAWRAALSRRV